MVGWGAVKSHGGTGQSTHPNREQPIELAKKPELTCTSNRAFLISRHSVAAPLHTTLVHSSLRQHPHAFPLIPQPGNSRTLVTGSTPCSPKLRKLILPPPSPQVPVMALRAKPTPLFLQPATATPVEQTASQPSRIASIKLSCKPPLSSSTNLIPLRQVAGFSQIANEYLSPSDILLWRVAMHSR